MKIRVGHLPFFYLPTNRNRLHLVNKQLNDKERVAAALENNALLDVVNGCLSTAGLRGRTDHDATSVV